MVCVSVRKAGKARPVRKIRVRSTVLVEDGAVEASVCVTLGGRVRAVRRTDVPTTALDTVSATPKHQTNARVLRAGKEMTVPRTHVPTTALGRAPVTLECVDAFPRLLACLVITSRVSKAAKNMARATLTGAVPATRGGRARPVMCRHVQQSSSKMCMAMSTA